MFLGCFFSLFFCLPRPCSCPSAFSAIKCKLLSVQIIQRRNLCYIVMYIIWTVGHITQPSCPANGSYTALSRPDWIERAHGRQQPSPPVTLESPGHSCVAAIMSLAVTLLSYILCGGKQERVQRPHFNRAASPALVCVDSYACGLSRSTKHANQQDIIINTRQLSRLGERTVHFVISLFFSVQSRKWTFSLVGYLRESTWQCVLHRGHASLRNGMRDGSFLGTRSFLLRL